MRLTEAEIDGLSDTFVSYNDAIDLAREVRRLRRILARAKRRTP
jgi:hypothetical protein